MGFSFGVHSSGHRRSTLLPDRSKLCMSHWSNQWLTSKIELQEVQFTRGAYGPVMVLSCWAKGYQEPLYVVSNMDAAEEACRLYQKRFRIETFFSDQKSRGFHIHKSHISDPQRLARLLIAACLAYIWIVYLGSVGEREGWISIIHRMQRCDL